MSTLPYPLGVEDGGPVVSVAKKEKFRAPIDVEGRIGVGVLTGWRRRRDRRDWLAPRARVFESYPAGSPRAPIIVTEVLARDDQ